jgi:hypothetical protein
MRFGQGDITARERSITTQRKQALNFYTLWALLNLAVPKTA